MWLSATVIENTLIVLDLAKVQDVYKHAALSSETLETCEKSLEELVWRCVSLLRKARFQRTQLQVLGPLPGKERRTWE